jgi:heme-degrading monooxygenase HmoA
MPWVRMSLMQPKNGRTAEVQQLLGELADYFAEQDGFIEGYTLQAKDGLVGRVTVWDSESAADHSAQTDHVLAIRSRLNPAVEEGSHQEHAFEGDRFVRITDKS